MGVPPAALAELRRRFTGPDGPRPTGRLLAALARDPRPGAAALHRLLVGRRRRLVLASRRAHALLGPERRLWRAGVTHVAGVDEAGVGPLAGPVVAAAVILPRGLRLLGLDDSKVLSPARRASLHDRLRREAVAIGVGRAEADEIDRLNIFQAGRLAMRRAVEALTLQPDHLLVDARSVPGWPRPQTALIHGDARSASIAAASVIAKVTRDRLMEALDREHPVYGFARHKGYPTTEHRAALARHGPCPVHRASFTLQGRARPPQGRLELS